MCSFRRLEYMTPRIAMSSRQMDQLFKGDLPRDLLTMGPPYDGKFPIRASHIFRDSESGSGILMGIVWGLRGPIYWEFLKILLHCGSLTWFISPHVACA